MDANTYILNHVYTNTYEQKQTKGIGTYSSRANALAALARVRDKVGFRDHPEGFRIETVPLDVDGWTDGFSIAERVHETWRKPAVGLPTAWAGSDLDAEASKSLSRIMSCVGIAF